MRWLFPLVVALALAPLAHSGAGGAAGAAPPACPTIETVAPYGPACRTPTGELALFTQAGTFLGLSHGVDPVLPEDTLTAQPADADGNFPRAPACVEDPIAPLDAHALVIYARAHDDDDNYAAKIDTIRGLVRSANGVLHDAADATGTGANIKVHCTNGEITVANEALPTDKARASYATIMDDLEARGYNSLHVKYWVYYDDRGACGCGGIALLYNDDTAGPTNLNNGYAVFPQFAITFDYVSTRIMLHELGHTMGAVQTSAPNTSGAGHCIDGWDILCYKDGGSRAHLYSTSHCATMVFDCGKDDYFNTNPPSGSYLDTHWNIGSRWNRFLDFEDNLVYGPV